MIHSFSESLKRERNFAIKANKFYSEELNATKIKRFNNDTANDLELQRQDIDVQVTIKGTKFNISEKFREKNFGDLYIEVFSKYPHTMGWMHTGSPDAIVYFTPDSVYWITHKTLKAFCDVILFPAIPHAWYDEIFKSGKAIASKQLILNGKNCKINLIQAHNFEGKAWETIGLSIDFDVLEHFGVKFKKISKPFFPSEKPNHSTHS